MRLSEVAGLLDCEVLLGAERLAGIEVQACFAADLMSDVLRFSHSGALLITGLTSLQSIHTANVADLAAILFVSSKVPGRATIDLARANDIPLLTTPHDMFAACGVLHCAGLARAPEAGAVGAVAGDARGARS
jgi:predicted transcriptional regulator